MGGQASAPVHGEPSPEGPLQPPGLVRFLLREETASPAAFRLGCPRPWLIWGWTGVFLLGAADGETPTEHSAGFERVPEE